MILLCAVIASCDDTTIPLCGYTILRLSYIDVSVKLLRGTFKPISLGETLDGPTIYPPLGGGTAFLTDEPTSNESEQLRNQHSKVRHTRFVEHFLLLSCRL